MDPQKLLSIFKSQFIVSDSDVDIIQAYDTIISLLSLGTDLISKKQVLRLFDINGEDVRCFSKTKVAVSKMKGLLEVSDEFDKGL